MRLEDQWLLVKREWVPIERALRAQAGAAGDACARIDRLADRLPECERARLHALRRQRNALIHRDIPLPDPARWQRSAHAALACLQRLPPAGPPRRRVRTAWRGLLLGALWLGVSQIGAGFCTGLLAQAPAFSPRWWGLGLLWLLCWPGACMWTLLQAGLGALVHGVAGRLAGGG